MPKCLCEMCTPNPAFTYTEEYRHQCEVRYVLRLAEERRAEYLALVLEERGPNARLVKEFRRNA